RLRVPTAVARRGPGSRRHQRLGDGRVPGHGRFAGNARAVARRLSPPPDLPAGGQPAAPGGARREPRSGAVAVRPGLSPVLPRPIAAGWGDAGGSTGDSAGRTATAPDRGSRRAPPGAA